MRAICIPMVACSVLIAGCATPPTRTATAPDPSMVKLADTAAQVQDAWKTLGAIEQARAPDHLALIERTSLVSTEALNKRVTLSMEGDLEVVVRKLLSAHNISVFVVNSRPSRGIPVVGRFTDARLIDVLRDLGYQAGNRGTIKVNAEDGAEFVEIVYAPN